MSEQLYVVACWFAALDATEFLVVIPTSSLGRDWGIREQATRLTAEDAVAWVIRLRHLKTRVEPA